jgi:hypothetical protein
VYKKRTGLTHIPVLIGLPGSDWIDKLLGLISFTKGFDVVYEEESCLDSACKILGVSLLKLTRHFLKDDIKIWNKPTCRTQMEAITYKTKVMRL